jgi:hypothetical protein
MILYVISLRITNWRVRSQPFLFRANDCEAAGNNYPDPVENRHSPTQLDHRRFYGESEKFGAEFILTLELFCVAIVVAFIKQPVSM